MSFPKDFTWGAAAAAYQIEGGAFEDGKGLSTWDVFCRREGAIWSGHSGDVACDHYHRYRQDVAVMKKIGLKAYRLSISWPRVMPAGTGAVNEKGVEFYSRLVDSLLAAGITPYVTLFHWDYPYELFLKGGWLHPDSPRWFADYASVIMDRLSDRVRHWMTLNEPQCFIGMGHLSGHSAPGLKLSLAEALLAGHHCLLAHGLAVQAIRAGAKSLPIVGYAPASALVIPASDSKKDIAAARQAAFGITRRDCWNSSWWMDPVFLGRYPAEGLALYGKDAPPVRSGDMETISQDLDFFGVNIYHGTPFRAGPDGKPQQVDFPPGAPMTAYPWNVVPQALYWGPKFFYERYRKPVFITENGLSSMDWVSVDGKVHDPLRIDYMTRYLRELRRAIADGVDVRGYFHWSILDNFEWHQGYKDRFGLVHVNYQTQERILKDSALWYKKLIATNGASLGK